MTSHLRNVGQLSTNSNQINQQGSSSSSSSTGYCKVFPTSDASSSGSSGGGGGQNQEVYETTWLMPTTFLSIIPNTTESNVEEAVKQLMHKFRDERDVQQLINQKASRQKNNFDLKIGKGEGRFCQEEFENFQISVYYYNFDQIWFVVGVKIVNKDPQHSKIEAIDLIECRSAIPTPSYSECGGSVTSPTMGGSSQFETEYEYTIHMVIDKSLYQLIVSGFGLVHFEKISTLEQEN